MPRRDAIYELDSELTELNSISIKISTIADELADSLGGQERYTSLKSLQVYADIVSDYAKAAATKLNELLAEINVK